MSSRLYAMAVFHFFTGLAGIIAFYVSSFSGYLRFTGVFANLFMMAMWFTVAYYTHTHD